KLAEKQKTKKMEKDNIQTPKTKEEMLIRELETISPKQLLADLSNGNQASEQDMRVIRDVMTSQGLPAPVMNVLLYYLFLQSNIKISKAYIEKIASHWSRAKLKTAKEAIKFAKKELKQFQKKPNQERSYQRNRRANQKEVIPDWFQNRNKPTSDVTD